MNVWLAYFCLALAMAIVGGYIGFSKALVIVFPENTQLRYRS